jgi:hypothetical protein
LVVGESADCGTNLERINSRAGSGLAAATANRL